MSPVIDLRYQCTCIGELRKDCQYHIGETDDCMVRLVRANPNYNPDKEEVG
jgi:hypothetical protein